MFKRKGTGFSQSEGGGLRPARTSFWRRAQKTQEPSTPTFQGRIPAYRLTEEGVLSALRTFFPRHKEWDFKIVLQNDYFCFVTPVELGDRLRDEILSKREMGW